MAIQDKTKSPDTDQSKAGLNSTTIPNQNCCHNDYDTNLTEAKAIHANKQTANYKDLMVVGFKEHQAREIIHQAKINLVNEGLALYNGKRIGVVPVRAVEKIIGFPLYAGGTDRNGKD